MPVPPQSRRVLTILLVSSLSSDGGEDWGAGGHKYTQDISAQSYQSLLTSTLFSLQPSRLAFDW